MLKNLWFQTHWLLGITAGVVLAVIGLTGATLSFEHDILRALNPAVMTVTPAADGALAPVELIRRARAAAPDKTVIGLTLDRDPTAAAQIGFSGGRRGDWHYLNPYTGELLGKPSRGEDFLHLMEDIHRRLAAGDTGKQIVGACTIALLVLALSGLYLRWPRQAGNWRTWLTFSWARKGRSFLWDLHSVIGTWLLPLYLLAALTGLYWSYDWYRDGLFELTGAPRPTPPAGQMANAGQKPMGAGGQASDSGAKSDAKGGEKNAPNAAAATAERGGDSREKAAAPTLSDIDIERLWPAFLSELPDAYRTATLRFPERAGAPVEFRYLDANPAHERASNTLSFDRETLAVVKHERYNELKPGAKLMRSMFVLHSGSFFGLTGLILMMIASLLMPLFAITGWLLYLDRRGKKRAARNAAAGLGKSNVSTAEPLLIGYASQTGYAEQLAWQTAGTMQAAGFPVQVQPMAAIDGGVLAKFNQALFVVSTFGDGEAPDGARPFAKRLAAHDGAGLANLRYAVLALGDRQYQAFCGFGRALDHWLRKQGANAMFAPVEVDKGDPAAIALWQLQLQQLTGSAEQQPWQEPSSERWRLLQRDLLNPGSLGAPMFQLALVPAQTGATASWQAGDLVDIWPRQNPERIEPILQALWRSDDKELSKQLAEQLARSELPDARQLTQWQQLPTREIIARLQTLQVRSYSIASIPQDGSLNLLVRQERHRDGSLGIGSGWLTEHLRVGGDVELLIRRNPSFHCDDYQHPLILIGNGSGLSSLRSHLRTAAEQGSKGHWLIFGERSQRSDFYYQAEIAQWQADGTLARVDLAFSRDQEQRIHVQDRLREQADELKARIAAGAAIYVCGSAQGMAPAVEQVLLDVLGSETVTELLEAGRYRRDVY